MTLNALLLLDTREPVCSVGVVGTDMCRIGNVRGFGRRVAGKRGGCAERIALALACWVTVAYAWRVAVAVLKCHGERCA